MNQHRVSLGTPAGGLLRCRSLRAQSTARLAWQRFCRARRRQLTDSVHNHETTLRTPKLARLEAALFVAEGALSARRLAQMATLADAREATTLIEELNSAYDQDRTAFRVEQVASGFQLLTRPVLAPWLDKVHHRQSRMKLSPPMLETLAIVAYRQPCTRADVEAVRGVQAAEMMKQLMERGLVRVAGEDNSLGRPYLYATTRLFLETFGLSNLNDLPMSERLRREPVKEDEETDTAESLEANEQSSTENDTASAAEASGESDQTAA